MDSFNPTMIAKLGNTWSGDSAISSGELFFTNFSFENKINNLLDTGAMSFYTGFNLFVSSS